MSHTPAISPSEHSDAFDSIPDVVAELASGRMIVLLDDEDRENEGDLVAAADFATPDVVNFMITHGRGLVCVSITPGRAEELGLIPMVSDNSEIHTTAFTVSVDGAPACGVTTGISAYERARTIELLLHGDRSELRSPGHMFPLIARPGGTLERRGHTEASVDLARLAGLTPAGVIVEIVGDDGRMLRGGGLIRFARRHGLPITTIGALSDYLTREARSLS